MAVTHDKSAAAWLSAVAYDAYEAAFRTASIETASDIGAALVRRLGPLTPAHHVARTNLRIAFPDLGEQALAALLDEVWSNLGRTFAEFPHLQAFTIYEPGARVEVVGAHRMREALEGGRGAIFLGGHFANFECLAITIVNSGLPCRITYRPANNYWVDKRIREQREAYGIRLLAAKGKEGGMSLLRALAKGEAVGIMNDQKYNEGVAVPFFGLPAMTADGPTRLARRYGCPILPFDVKRLPRARFRVTIYDEIPTDTDTDEETAVTNTVARITQFIEARVRENPADWFWVHRRWPKDVYKTKRA